MIIIVGPLPPPVHGAALITQRVTDRLAAQGFRLLTCSTAPGKTTARWQYHLSRISAYLHCWSSILRSRVDRERSSAVYVSLSGGFGLLYDFVVIALARLKRYDVVLHHHSFSYLARPSRIMGAITRIAGADQLHIALCSRMASSVSQRYGVNLKTVVVSNLAFFDLAEPDRPLAGRKLSKIGYLSNISRDKGIGRFLDMMAELRSRNSKVAACIAGPFGDADTEAYVRRRIGEIGGIDYVGPVFDGAKDRFLSSIDVLVFPTRYVHEAQPLVIFEAQAAGALVSATDRGCIPDMVSRELLLDPSASDLTKIVDQLLAWEKDASAFSTALEKVDGLRLKLREQRQQDFDRFYDVLRSYKE